jgi:transcriptional regulator with XRE-family HTH domain
MKKTTTQVQKHPKRMEIGSRLKKFMLMAGIDQKDVEAKGKSRGFTFNASNISLIWSGERPINGEVIEVLIEDFKINPSYLYGSSTEMFINSKKELPLELASISDLEQRISVVENNQIQFLKNAKFIRVFADLLKKKKFKEIELLAVSEHLEKLEPKN